MGTYTRDSPERAIGKVADLALGYSGGLAAWRRFDPDRFSDDEIKEFIRAWRAAHPNIKKLWYRLDRAAWVAVQQRGRVVRCGIVTFKCNGLFLQLTLPSGRKISYPQPASSEMNTSSVLFSLIMPLDSSRTADTDMALMAAYGLRMLSVESPATCSRKPCCGLKPPDIQ
jgi:hypothetical protein